MQGYSINEIANIVKGKLYGSANYLIQYLLIDSRTLFSPQESLFFAITGERHDGHNFIRELYQKGVKNFIVNSLSNQQNEMPEANFILVQDTLNALQLLSAHHRKQFNLPIVGITGSNGKTIVKEWIYQLLALDKNIIRNPKSYNSQVGVPLSIWLLNDHANFGIFEAGISKENEMVLLQHIIRPTIGIFTNIGDAHQENFIDQKQKVREKLKLFTESEIIIYNKDYYLIDDLIQSDKRFENRIFTWSTKFPADLNIIAVKKEQTETLITGKIKSKVFTISIPFTDDASVENSIHCWALMLYLGYEQEVISERIATLNPVAMRLELKAGINNCTLINDYYNSDLDSIRIALDYLVRQTQHNKKTLILSDILQSGTPNQKLYHEVANMLAKKQVDKIIGIGPIISHQAKLFSMQKEFYASTEEFINKLSDLHFRDEAILLKGARTFEFEKISAKLQQKTHNTVLEINLNAIINNLNFFRSLLNPGTKVMAMVKAFSYGSGMYEIANVLQYQKVDYLAVAYTDEGNELRKAGISLPIMVMNPESHGFDQMFENNLEPEIYGFRILHSFLESLKKSGLTNFPIHIKIETGMKRLGFFAEELDELITVLTNNPHITVKSVFTHLAASDKFEHDAFTRLQFSRFYEASNKITKALKYPVMRHILNSSGVERFPEAQYDMVRLGIGLYGISSTKQEKLLHVSTLKTIISQIKKIPAFETIGYGRLGQLKHDSVIAIIPVGYADGLSRRLSNGIGSVIVNGQPAKIIGNICMDMCMIDITEIPAKEGDEVIIFGKENTISQLAQQAGTIPYEILTGISQRVKRIYYHE